LNYQDSSVPKPLSQKFARKQGFLCPGFLPTPAFEQTLIALGSSRSEMELLWGITNSTNLALPKMIFWVKVMLISSQLTNQLISQ